MRLFRSRADTSPPARHPRTGVRQSTYAGWRAAVAPGVVWPEPATAALARDARSVRDPRLRGDAAADAGLEGGAALARVARTLAYGRGAGRGEHGAGDPRVAGARLQPPRAQPATGRPCRRRKWLARRPDRAAGGRALHGGGGRLLRLRAPGAAGGRERAPSSGANGRGFRPHLRGGAEGPRRDGRHRPRPALRQVPALCDLPVARPPVRAAAQAGALRRLVQAAAGRGAARIARG